MEELIPELINGGE